MKKIGLTFVVGLFSIVLSIAWIGCGGSSGGGATTDTTLRTMSGDIGDASASLSELSAKGADEEGESVSGCVEDVAKVIATATDGTTVIDDELDDCQFSLPLVVGKWYIIAFLDSDNEPVGIMVFSSTSVFPVEAGSEMDFGEFSFIGGVAQFSENFLCFLDTDNDGTVDCLDATPCGEDISCMVFLTCEASGFEDDDQDGICNNFEEDAWADGWDFVMTECSSDADCADDQFCPVCSDGPSWMEAMPTVCVPTAKKCDSENACSANEMCFEMCPGSNFGLCDYVGNDMKEGCDDDFDCKIFGPGSTCDTDEEACTFPEESCETNSDCWMIQGAMCFNDVCEGGQIGGCYKDSDCNNSAAACVGFQCVAVGTLGPQPCTSNAECDGVGNIGAFECMGGMCMFNGACSTNDECTAFYGNSQVCNSQTGFCEMGIKPCSAQGDCEPGYTCESDIDPPMCSPSTGGDEMCEDMCGAANEACVADCESQFGGSGSGGVQDLYNTCPDCESPGSEQQALDCTACVVGNFCSSECVGFNAQAVIGPGNEPSQGCLQCMVTIQGMPEIPTEPVPPVPVGPPPAP